jgi:hypothetical protein
MPECPPPVVIAGWLRLATLAPSMHNTQPWRFRVSRSDQIVELYADPSRMLVSSDPHGRPSISRVAPPCSTCDWRSRPVVASPL